MRVITHGLPGGRLDRLRKSRSSGQATAFNVCSPRVALPMLDGRDGHDQGEQYPGRHARDRSDSYVRILGQPALQSGSITSPRVAQNLQISHDISRYQRRRGDVPSV